MIGTLSLMHRHQETIALPPCDSCDQWERHYAIQSNKLDQLEKQLVDRDQQLARLDQDMQHLNAKYVSAIDRMADIQHDKDLVEHDLEELSCKLFEEANGMVAIEKKEKSILETQLKATQQQLLDEQAQLKELRQRLLDWDAADEQHKQQRNNPLAKSKKQQQQQQQQRKKMTMNSKRKPQHYGSLATIQHNDDDKTLCNDDDTYDDSAGDDEDVDGSSSEEDTWQDANDGSLEDPEMRAHHDLALLHGVSPLSSYNDTTNTTKSRPVPSLQYTNLPTIDKVQLEAFQQFVQVAGTMPLKKLSQITYLKYCQLEDVEPCLRFGPHSRLSTKKMVSHLLHQSCFIQHMCLDSCEWNPTTPTTATAIPVDQPILPSSVSQRPLLWDRWYSFAATTNVSMTMTCVACGRSCNNRADLSSFYQFKMNENDTWLPMDQYCRDRLVAVCEFFVFIRNIHLRLYSHRTIDDLYSENIRLRLQMFYSRMGALPIILNGMGLNADSVGKACPPLDRDDVSDGSLSSYCPATPK
ncbi:hypothetical protein BCR42DRAFT_488684 [Absidia repens]|uniref:GDP/GTP exchange factor Sec2 N-terminal domain-containing protein n=1 Tax=Absidia repens TaxID=90262 RepID=A0A1X2ISX0_9FUNG|nr:hypothetical protein BCR42DRAFT_488684 [Absidia repens]